MGKVFIGLHQPAQGPRVIFDNLTGSADILNGRTDNLTALPINISYYCHCQGENKDMMQGQITEHITKPSSQNKPLRGEHIQPWYYMRLKITNCSENNQLYPSLECNVGTTKVNFTQCPQRLEECNSTLFTRL